MMDIIENMEAAAESRIYDMTEGLPEGKFRCDCGEIDDLAHAAPSGPSPYSAPMCGKCLDQMMNTKEPTCQNRQS